MKAFTYQSKKQVKISRLAFASLMFLGLLFSSYSCCNDDIPETEPETVVIMFGVDVGEGELIAEVDGEEINSPAEIEKGKTVVFKAIHSKSWTVKYWKKNGEIIRYIDPVLTLEGVSNHLDIRLGLKKWEATPAE